MSLLNSTGERLRRATQLWHTYLAATGQRFELAQFLKDPVIEKQTLDGALASGDAKLIALAQDWLRDTGQAVPAAGRRSRRHGRPGRGSRRGAQGDALPARRTLKGAHAPRRKSAPKRRRRTNKKRRANARRFVRARN